MITWRRSFVRPATNRRAGSLLELYRECTPQERELSLEYPARYLSGRGTGDLTPFAGIRNGPGVLQHGASLARSKTGDLRTRLEGVLDSAASGNGETAVAVSGGIDSWILAGLLKRLGHRVRGYLLVSGVPGYCERDRAMRLAESAGIECEEVRTSAEEFREALPEFAARIETPIYNLHPVSKLLLARALAKRGIRRIIGGDGADQVMRHDWDCDLLPITFSCFTAMGVELVTPFLDDRVIAICGSPDPGKAPVRELARCLGLPSFPKRATLFPGVEPQACLAHTTELLVEHLEVFRSCAVSRA